MDSKVIDAKVSVMNCPNELRTGYMVVRLVETLLWYYGLYDTIDRAEMAATELGNGFVIGIIQKGEKK